MPNRAVATVTFPNGVPTVSLAEGVSGAATLDTACGASPVVVILDTAALRAGAPGGIYTPKLVDLLTKIERRLFSGPPS